MIRVKLSVFNEGGPPPRIYINHNAGLKLEKKKKRDPYYHQITLVEKKFTDFETYICIHKLNSFVYQIKDGKLTFDKSHHYL